MSLFCHLRRFLRCEFSVVGFDLRSALPALPWQSFKSPAQASQLGGQRVISTTMPFTVDVLVPTTWMDPLRPSLQPSPSLSPASLTPSHGAFSASSLCPNPCKVCRAFHLPDCVRVCHSCVGAMDSSMPAPLPSHVAVNHAAHPSLEALLDDPGHSHACGFDQRVCSSRQSFVP